MDAPSLATYCVVQGCRSPATFSEVANFVLTRKFSSCLPQADIQSVGLYLLSQGCQTARDLEEIQQILDLVMPLDPSAPPNPVGGYGVEINGGLYLIAGGPNGDSTTTAVGSDWTLIYSVRFSGFLVLQSIAYPNVARVQNSVYISNNLALTVIDLGNSAARPLIVGGDFEISWNFLLTTLDLHNLNHVSKFTVSNNHLLTTLNLDGLVSISSTDRFSGLFVDTNLLTDLIVPNLVQGTAVYPPRIDVHNDVSGVILFTSLEHAGVISVIQSGTTSVSFPALTQCELVRLQADLSLAGINFPLLSSITSSGQYSIQIESCHSLFQIRFPQMISCGATCRIRLNNGLVSVLFDVVQQVGNLEIEDNPLLTFISMPLLLSIANVTITNNPSLAHLVLQCESAFGIELSENDNMTYFRCPHLTVMTNALTVVDNSALTEITCALLAEIFDPLHEMQAGDYFLVIDNCPALTTLNLASLTSIFHLGQNVQITRCPSLTTANLGSFVPQNGATFSFVFGAWNSAFINVFLARCVANPAFVSGRIDFGVNLFGPTGQGVVDKATLIARGVTVVTI